MYRIRTGMILCIVLFISFECSSAGDKSEDEVIESFTKLVENAVSSTNNTPDIGQQAFDWKFSEEKGWAKYIYKVYEVSFDIRKTTSVISPYQGLVWGKSRSIMLGPYYSKREAEAATLENSNRVAPNPPAKGNYEFKLTYAYQSGKWILKDSIARLVFPTSTGKWRPAWRRGTQERYICRAEGLVYQYWMGD